MLTVMHNNRAYNTEVMEVENMAGQHHRDIGRCLIGTAIDDPAIDFASVAKGLGWYAEGPIADPKELGRRFAALWPWSSVASRLSWIPSHSLLEGAS